MGCGTSAGSSVTDTKAKGKASTKSGDALTYEQVAGHAEAIKFDGNRMTKACNIEEIQNYRLIFPEDKV